MNVVDTIKNEAGFYAELYYDQSASDPRQDDVHFLWVGIRGRRDAWEGDEQISEEMDCPLCGGCGHGESQSDCDTDARCPLCGGWGSACDDTDMLEKFVVHIYKPLHVRRIAHDSHGPQSRYQIADHGRDGFLLYTAEKKEMWGTPDDQDIDEMMAAEMAEFTDWANGEVYGVRIFDPNGDATDDECWGLVGEYAWGHAREQLATWTAADVPEKLYAVPRMTRREINVIAHCLALFDGDAADAAESAFNKLATIERSE